MNSMVTQTKSTQLSDESSQADWSALLADVLAATDRPESLERGFRDALGAVTDSMRRGYITEQQANELVAQLAAMMIYAKFTELIEDWGFRARRGRGPIRLTHASTRLSSPRSFKPAW
jgi:hypothetical protein